jgi:hypothetical protein
MRTYIVEIDGEAVMAFRAEDYAEARTRVHGKESEQGGIKTVLLEYNRTNGRPLWNGISELTTRVANESEARRWEKVCATVRGPGHEGYLIDLQNGEDPDDFNAFLIPIVDPLEADEGDGLSASQ